MDLSSHIACQNCDLIHELQYLKKKEVAKCSRCKNDLYLKKDNFIDRTLCLSIAAFIMFIPANLIPILSMSAIGNTQANSLITGVIELFHGGNYFVSILVLMTSIVLPFISISTLLYTMISIKLDRPLPHVGYVFRLNEHIHNLVMLEVYMLGILVALTKLNSIAEVIIGLGLYCYILLLLLTIFSTLSFDNFVIWKRMEQWAR